jgi:starvation-inducible DNA-binding protein
MKTYISDQELVSQMNGLLSDFQVFYQNLRAFHWLVAGPQFYQLHESFEAFYDEAAEDIDQIAERILMIGGKPLHTFSDYLENATLKPQKDLTRPAEMIPVLVDDLEHLLGTFRRISKIAGDADDEGTVALMGDFIGKTEKKLWMLNSFQA